MLLLYRVGSGILLPFLNPTAVAAAMNTNNIDPNSIQSVLNVINSMTGGNLGQTTLFALGVQPYINSSIIIQLLTAVIPALERLSKEGEEGQKKMQAITRWTALGLAVLQSVAYYIFMLNNDFLRSGLNTFESIVCALMIIAMLIAGAMLVVWMGEEIDRRGIGNGVSLLIFAGIVARLPQMMYELYVYFRLGIEQPNYAYLVGSPIMLVLYLAMIVAVVWMSAAERRVPVQYAKRVVGRKQYGGQNTHLPLKVNMAGVLPIIFASSFLSLPQMIKAFAGVSDTSTFGKILNVFHSRTPVYAILYFVLIFAFTYFYSTIQVNPMDMANNIRKNSGAVPGIRPGKPTADFIRKIVTKIDFVSGLFLAIIAVLPIIFGIVTGMNFAIYGTSVIIIVGVALELVQSMESQMMMRHYKGFLS
jgi:preprotein translocase subunit SecY